VILRAFGWWRYGLNPLSVSVVTATWNERETLPELVQQIHNALRGFDHEIIVVDDNSPDGTYEVAAGIADQAVCKRREGQSIALLTGVRRAIYPVVVTIDADLENDPALIPSLLAKLEEGYDLVVASRSKLPRWSERLFSATIGRRVGVTDVLSNFRAIRTEQAKAIELQKGDTFGAEFLIKAYERGLRMTEILVAPSPRRKHPRIGNTITANLRILRALLRALFV
jgi:dolichol-phosphate mannosyltransferase